MTAQEQAILDIKDELHNQHKSFIAFRTELNPTMKSLVRRQITAQRNAKVPTYVKVEKVARCFFAKGKVEYFNYRNKYANK